MNTQRFQHTVVTTVRYLGGWTSLCIALIIIVITASYFRVGSLINTRDSGMANLAGRQRMLVQKIAKDALAIKVSLIAEDWETIESALTDFTVSTSTWNNAHSSLRIHSANSFIPEGDTENIFAHYEYLDYPYSQISQASAELTTVSQSIVRRAPFIDKLTFDRAIAAVDVIQKHDDNFLKLMDEIVDHYQVYSARSSNKAANAIRQSLVIIFTSMVIAFVIGVAPRLWSMACTIKQLKKDYKLAQKKADSHWNFLAVLGHEFQRPLSSVLGFSSMIAHEKLDQECIEEHANSITIAGRSMTNLVDDILDMAAIHNNKLRVSSDLVNPRQILEDIVQRYGNRARNKKLEFRSVFDDSCPTSITSDPKRLKQIVSKIVENAIKFTNSGSVELHAALETVGDKELLMIRVVDTGIGIDPKNIDSAFEPFKRLQRIDGSTDGAGLGLTVARELSRKLGGDITIESALGAGCIVSIGIDLGEYIANTAHTSNLDLHKNEQEVVDLTVLEHKRVLIVDDDEVGRRLISHILTKAGCTIKFADNGRHGIERVLEAQGAEDPFELIIMDMQMPVMDGFEATAVLREEEIITPIVAITAHDTAGDKDQCLSAGCDDYLAKPVRKEKLLKTCARWISWNNMLLEQAKEEKKAA